MSASFADSYLGQLRKLIGPRPVLMPGTRVVVENAAGEVLLIQRGDFRLWGWPAGSAELGQTIEQTARQELLEETGLTAHRLTPIGFASDPEHDRIEYPHGDVLYAFSMVFHVTEWSGTPRPDHEESLAARFFGPDSLPEDRLSQVSRTLELLERYRSSGGAFQMG